MSRNLDLYYNKIILKKICAYFIIFMDYFPGLYLKDMFFKYWKSHINKSTNVYWPITEKIETRYKYKMYDTCSQLKLEY